MKLFYLALSLFSFSDVLAMTDLDALRLHLRKLDDNSTDTNDFTGGDGKPGGGKPGGGFPGLCFSAFNDVEVQGKGFVSMDSVKVGDYVYAGNGAYSRVFSLAHLDHEYETDFLQIYTENSSSSSNNNSNNSNKPLEITGKHMLFVSNNNNRAIRADEVRLGDMLDGNNKVIDIKSVTRTGLYAPVTELGEIVVSGVRASSYPAFMDHVPSFGQHNLIHLFFGPHRLLCSYNFGLCNNEKHTDGYTNYAHWAIQIMEQSNHFVAPVQYLLTGLALPVLSVAYGFEQIVSFPLITLAVVSYMIYKRNQKISI